MPFATLSPEVRGPSMLRELGASNAFASALCRIEETRLSKAFRQIKELSNEDGLRLVKTLARLIELRDAIAPFQIDLKNPTNAKALLELFDGFGPEIIQRNLSEFFLALRSMRNAESEIKR